MKCMYGICLPSLHPFSTRTLGKACKLPCRSTDLWHSYETELAIVNTHMAFVPEHISGSFEKRI